MRVFVTGATGFVGSAVVQDLLAAGYEVVGMARSDKATEALTAAGATVLRASLDDLDSLKRGAAESDGVIHTAFIHDFSKFAENCAIDECAITAMGEALEGSGRPLIVTSGVGIVRSGPAGTEQDPPYPVTPAYPRASEHTALAFADRGLNPAVVRLPPSVHGAGDHGFVAILINIAREKGVSAFIGDGQNRWPAVHRFDAAVVYRLALEEKAAVPRYHAVAEEGVPFREIAETIGRGLNLPVVSKTPEKAAEHFTWFTEFAKFDVPTTSEQTRKRLGWQPKQAGLIADIRANYFAA